MTASHHQRCRTALARRVADLRAMLLDGEQGPDLVRVMLERLMTVERIPVAVARDCLIAAFIEQLECSGFPPDDVADLARKVATVVAEEAQRAAEVAPS